MPKKSIKKTMKRHTKTQKKGGDFKKGVQCEKDSNSKSYKVIQNLSKYITYPYNWSIHKTTGHFCDLFIWKSDEQKQHIHVYSIEGNIVYYSVKYHNGSHLHHQQVYLANDTEFEYKNVLDEMCRHINPDHVSFNLLNLKTPVRLRSPKSVYKPIKSMKKPNNIIVSDEFRKTQKLGPTLFKQVATVRPNESISLIHDV
jgi:hypothetical protein